MPKYKSTELTYAQVAKLPPPHMTRRQVDRLLTLLDLLANSLPPSWAKRQQSIARVRLLTEHTWEEVLSPSWEVTREAAGREHRASEALETPDLTGLG